jgi:hypothetical protein
MRSLKIRNQKNPNIAHLEYPFEEIRNGYEMEYRGIPGKSIGEELDDLKFPDGVEEYLWIHEGCNDEDDWRCLCRMKNGLFLFYRGGCDFTGFDCQGFMCYYVAKDCGDLIQFAMGDDDYRLYCQIT